MFQLIFFLHNVLLEHLLEHSQMFLAEIGASFPF
jgi:hypothetical protein